MSRVTAGVGESGVAQRTMARVATPLAARYPQKHPADIGGNELRDASLHLVNQQADEKYQEKYSDALDKENGGR
jgi:hypothetical protein